jgi:hypothetical protein
MGHGNLPDKLEVMRAGFEGVCKSEGIAEKGK